MHRVTCGGCGRECGGRTLIDAQNVRAACHGDRKYSFARREVVAVVQPMARDVFAPVVRRAK